jgi:hypothetical protein
LHIFNHHLTGDPAIPAIDVQGFRSDAAAVAQTGNILALIQNCIKAAILGIGNPVFDHLCGIPPLQDLRMLNCKIRLQQIRGYGASRCRSISSSKVIFIRFEAAYGCFIFFLI